MERIDEKLRLLRPVLSPAQWGGLRIQYMFEKEPKKRMEIEQIIDFLIAKHVPGLKTENILLPPPERELLKGQYPIGEVMYPHKPFGLLLLIL